MIKISFEVADENIMMIVVNVTVPVSGPATLPFCIFAPKKRNTAVTRDHRTLSKLLNKTNLIMQLMLFNATI